MPYGDKLKQKLYQKLYYEKYNKKHPIKRKGDLKIDLMNFKPKPLPDVRNPSLNTKPKYEVNNYFTTASKDKLHQSIGLGFRVIMNQNFVVAFEYGHAIQKQDGVSGFYINLNYLF